LKKYADLIEKAPLFHGIKSSDLQSMSDCMSAEVRNVPKSTIVQLTGEKFSHIGLVLSGCVHVVKENADGKRTIVTAITPGQIYGEALTCAKAISPVTVSASEDSQILMFRVDRILHTCQNICTFHQRFIENLLYLMANKNIYLQNRLNIVSVKSVRAKVLRYLDSFDQKQGTTITVPFNREELADYLYVERTALSHELAKMKKDGLLDYRKNQFTLIKEDS